MVARHIVVLSHCSHGATRQDQTRRHCRCPVLIPSFAYITPQLHWSLERSIHASERIVDEVRHSLCTGRVSHHNSHGLAILSPFLDWTRESAVE